MSFAFTFTAIQMTDNPKNKSLDAILLTESGNVESPFLKWMTQIPAKRRFKFFVCGVIFPVICFLSIAVGGMARAIDAPWQSGRLEDYVTVLLSSPSILCFVPMLLFNITCMAIWCIRPEKSSSVIIRLGLYTGVLMSVMFLAMLSVNTMWLSEFIAIFVGLGLMFFAWIGRLIYIRFKKFTIKHMLIFTTCVAVLVAIDVATNYFRGSITSVFFMAIAASPTLCMVAFCQASFAASWSTRKSEKPLRLFGWAVACCVWISGLYISWKYAIAVMLVEYSKLSTANPNCYISCAAARGHRRLVGTGTSGLVNLQMQRLKLLEFGLATSFPTSHRKIRSVYNRLGPKLAQFCSSSA